MRLIVTKIMLLFSLLIASYFLSAIFVCNNIFPRLEHTAFLEKSNSRYIRTEHSFNDEPETFFLDNSKIRIHKTLHQNEDDVFSCEAENTNCYISSFLINAKETNMFLKKVLLQGKLPHNRNEIVINKKLAKRLHCKIGDKLCIKTAILFEQVQIVGIINDLYGFPDFDENSLYYTIINYGKVYPSKGTSYSFSDENKNAFTAEEIRGKIAILSKELYLWIVILSTILFCTQYLVLKAMQKTLNLENYYKHLYLLGKVKRKILLIKIKDTYIFLFACSFLIFFIGFSLGVRVIFWIAEIPLFLLCCIDIFLFKRRF